MKVLWLAPHPVPDIPNGHPAPWITSLAKRLSVKGVAITIISTSKILDQQERTYDLGSYKLIVLKAPSTSVDVLTLFTRRIGIVKKYLDNMPEKFDVVHVHGTEYQFGSSLPAKLKKSTPVVISIQGLIFQYKKYINDLFTNMRLIWEISAYYEKREIKRNTNFLCRTHWDKGSVLELNPQAKIYEVWELMREDFYETEITAFGDDILFSGGSYSIKGLEHCLKVFNKLLAGNKTRLHVIGNCSREYVNEVKHRHQLDQLNDSNVILHGMVGAKEILNIYKQCFCLYHPSVIDNSPNSICEAQLAGIPVIAANVGGVSSLIENGVTGILLNSNKPDEDFSTLSKYISNKASLKPIAKNAREVALKRHNPDSIINNILDVYANIKVNEAN